MEVHEKDGLEIIYFDCPAAYEQWLDDHHAEARGVWIKAAKKATGIPSVSWEDIVDVSLCYGWIDGQRKGYDDAYFVQRVTPRGKRSPWSKRNTEKALDLIAAGRMRPSGHAEIERAKSDGRWESAYAPQSQAEAPPDLQEFLDANPAAASFFLGLSSQNRYAFIYRLHSAKRPETRARRFDQFTTMLLEGKAFY